MENQKLSREEIYEELKGLIPFANEFKKKVLFNEMKGNVKTLQDLANAQKIADEDDIEILNWKILEASGIKTYQDLDDAFNKIEEGRIEYPEEQHNAIYGIFLFIDMEYQNQGKELKNGGTE